MALGVLAERETVLRARGGLVRLRSTAPARGLLRVPVVRGVDAALMAFLERGVWGNRTTGKGVVSEGLVCE